MTRFYMKKILPALFLPLFCLMFMQDQACAADSPARTVLEQTINQVLAELQKPELKNPATRDTVLQRVEGIIRGLFSFQELSMRTVGPEWKNFSSDQKNRFSAAFETLLRETYLEKLDGYNGEQVSYSGELDLGKNRVEIQTTVNIRNKPVPVSYRMIQRGNWVVYDVVIEGVSMVANYRSQFQSVLARDGAEKLIELVRIKADEARKLNRK
jgi:ABC-type transport system involved in resistance to organic solvents, auxiliary component